MYSCIQRVLTAASVVPTGSDHAPRGVDPELPRVSTPVHRRGLGATPPKERARLKQGAGRGVFFGAPLKHGKKNSTKKVFASSASRALLKLCTVEGAPDPARRPDSEEMRFLKDKCIFAAMLV